MAAASMTSSKLNIAGHSLLGRGTGWVGVIIAGHACVCVDSWGRNGVGGGMRSIFGSNGGHKWQRGDRFIDVLDL